MPNPACPDVLRLGLVGEYVDSVERCPKCGAELIVVHSPAADVRPSEESRRPPVIETALVSVLQTADEGLIALVKSLFEAEGIDYFLKGEGLQDLLGWGRIAGGFNYVVGPADFLVRENDADRARGLLADLRSDNDAAAQSDDDV